MNKEKQRIIRIITKIVKFKRNWINELKREFNITNKELINDWIVLKEEK